MSPALKEAVAQPEADICTVQCTPLQDSGTAPEQTRPTSGAGGVDRSHGVCLSYRNKNHGAFILRATLERLRAPKPYNRSPQTGFCWLLLPCLLGTREGRAALGRT